MNKILLGRIKDNTGTFADGQLCWLSKHTWDCGWYWGFGYLGNSNCHFHFSSFLQDTKYASELFSETNITDNEWWIIRDLFKQAYALKDAAEVYRAGGRQTTSKGITDIILNKDMENRINSDLKLVLNTLWEYICTAVNKKEK